MDAIIAGREKIAAMNELDLELYKLSGAGNDFLALVEPPREPDAAWIAAVCRRGLSLGADGILLLYRQPGGVRLVHFNDDGGRTDFCLNGSRASAQLCYQLGFCPVDEVLRLETDAGVLACRRLDPVRAEVGLPPGLVGPARRIELEAQGRSFAGWHVKAGVPHFVLLVDGALAEVPLLSWAPPLRRHPELGPGGANVNVARIVAPDRLEIRTFERGIEGETLACGSGVCAAVRAGLEAGGLDPARPISVLVAGGFELVVAVAGEGWRLAGDARVVARCRLEAGALAFPGPARFSS